MSEVNKEFEFIKEQVLPKKRKKFRKWLLPFLLTIFMAIIFGLVAALTFCISEPRLYRLLNKNESNPFVIPTPTPSGKDNDDNDDEYSNDNQDDSQGHIKEGEDVSDPEQNDDRPDGQAGDPNSQVNDPIIEPTPIIVEAKDADINDYLDMHKDIKKLYEEIGKAVLTVSSVIDGKDWFGNPIEKRIYTAGVVVGNTGTNLMILVSQDRVADASSIKVEINDTTALDATLYDYESELNLAVISVNIIDIPIKLLGDIDVARIGESHTLAVGSPVIALGSPNGYPKSIDMGIITSKGSLVSITDNELDLFNTNIVFNKESDGILINYRGEVIGLITRTLKKDLNKELSTVLGISKVKSYIDRMVSQKPRIYCGVVAENLPREAMEEYDVTRGVYVYEVKKDSPAFNAGLKSGDIILNVGDRIVTNMNNFYNAISEFEPEESVTFNIMRTSETSDKEIELQIQLEAKKQ